MAPFSISLQEKIQNVSSRQIMNRGAQILGFRSLW
jgi:hypothetical protein